MRLRQCKLCGKITTADSGICSDCVKDLGELYGSVHEYMRDHKDEKFDMEKLSEGLDIDPVYIKALVDLGYIEAIIPEEEDMNQKQRHKLAEAFSKELGKFQKAKITTYGGEIYARKQRDK